MAPRTASRASARMLALSRPPDCSSPFPSRMVSPSPSSRATSAMVNMTTLAEVARELGLGDTILLGKGEEQSGGRDKASILADALEAVLGAIYLDQGLKPAAALIERLFRPRIAAYVRGEGE